MLRADGLAHIVPVVGAERLAHLGALRGRRHVDDRPGELAARVEGVEQVDEGIHAGLVVAEHRIVGRAVHSRMSVHHHAGAPGGVRPLRQIVEEDLAAAVAHGGEPVAVGDAARAPVRVGLADGVGDRTGQERAVVVVGGDLDPLVRHLVGRGHAGDRLAEVAGAVMGVGGVDDDPINGNAGLLGLHPRADLLDEIGTDADQVGGDEDQQILAVVDHQGRGGDWVEHPPGDADVELAGNLDRLAGRDVARGPSDFQALRRIALLGLHVWLQFEGVWKVRGIKWPASPPGG